MYVLADGAFWNNPLSKDDWDMPVVPREPTPAAVRRPSREAHLSASQWLNQQHQRGFPKAPG